MLISVLLQKVFVPDFININLDFIVCKSLCRLCFGKLLYKYSYITLYYICTSMLSSVQ